jgi:rubredoxin
MHRQKSHLTRYPNADYNPFESRVETFFSCSVCGFKGIDAEKWHEPEQAVFSTETTGSTYIIPAGTAVEGLSAIDKKVFTQVGSHAACPFCGSPNWSFGSAPDLLW